MKQQPKREPTPEEMEIMIKEQQATMPPSLYNMYSLPRQDVRNRRPKVSRLRVLGVRRKYHAE